MNKNKSTPKKEPASFKIDTNSNDFKKLVKKYEKKLSVRSKSGTAIAFTLAAILALGGIGVGTYYAIKANNSSESKGDVPVSELCTVIFETNGGSPIEANIVKKGKKLDKSKVVTTKTDCTFSGWYKDSGLTEKQSLDDPITSSMTLYASWIPVEKDVLKFKLNSNKDGFIVDSLKGNKNDLISVSIPSSYTDDDGHTYDVVGINDYVFKNCIHLDQVKLPDTIQTIGRGAFSYCISLKVINLPDSLREIGDYGFCNCTNIESIGIPSNVTYMGEACFQGCERLTKIIIPDNVQNMGEKSFSDCSLLTDVTIGRGLSLIKSNSFKNCHSLKSIYIPINIQRIYDGAFESSALESITFEDEYSYWGYYKGATPLDPKKILDILLDGEEGIEKLPFVFDSQPNFAFKYIGTEEDSNSKVALVSASEDPKKYEYFGNTIVIPSTFTDNGINYKVVEIDSQGFCQSSFYSASKIVIPSTVRKIGYFGIGDSYAAYDEEVAKLNEIQFLLDEDGNSELESIDSYGICGLGNYYSPTSGPEIKIYTGPTYEGKNNLPKSLKTLASRAFDAVQIKEITLPSDIQSIHISEVDTESVFNDCKLLENINIDGDVGTTYTSDNGVLYKNGSDDESFSNYYSLLFVPPKHVFENDAFEVHEGTSVIESGAFTKCSKAPSTITLPSTLKTISNSSFISYKIPKTININSQYIVDITQEYISSNSIYLLLKADTINVPNSLNINDTSFIKESFKQDTSVTEYKLFKRTSYIVTGDLEGGYKTNSINFASDLEYKFIFNVTNPEYSENVFAGLKFLDSEGEVITTAFDNATIIVKVDGSEVTDYSINNGILLLGSDYCRDVGQYEFDVKLNASLTNAYAAGHITML